MAASVDQRGTTGLVHRDIPLEVPLDLARTLRLQEMWGATTWMKADASGGWYAMRTVQGPGTVHIVHAGDRLECQAWGPGAEEMLARVPRLCGLDNAGVEDVPRVDARVRELQKRQAGFRIGSSGDLYPKLIATALAQKVTGPNGKSALRQVAWKLGEQAPGPREDLWLLPPPRVLSKIPYYVLHPLNIEQHRASLIARIASRATALQRAAKMDPVEGRAHLEKLRGIGPWTSGVAMGGALGDADAVPVGDIHLPNWVSFNLRGEPRADDARMLELLEPYRPYRGLVARMIKGGGKGAPRYGPRMDVQDIR